MGVLWQELIWLIKCLISKVASNFHTFIVALIHILYVIALFYLPSTVECLKHSRRLVCG